MAAFSLRSFGFSGEIILIGAEADLPYERPELSKSYLSASVSAEKLQVLSPDQMRALNITFRQGETVSDILPGQKTLLTSIGGSLVYDHLLLATGGAPRQLEGCFALRSKADADAIRMRLGAVKSLGIVGAGWLGLELAAHARALDLETTVYEQGTKVCGRVLPGEVSDFLADYHRSTGLTLNLGQRPDLDTVLGQHDLTVACIGMMPHDALARAAGIDTNGGVLVDEFQRSSVADIYAIGDCARPAAGDRIESWAYANRSARRAAAVITGADLGQEDPLWFWSKQGTLSLQMIGGWGADLNVTVKNAPKGGKVWRFERAGTLVGLIAINSPRDFAAARRELQPGPMVVPPVP